MERRYVYNRAVGAHNKGDQFTADPSQPFVQSLLGAGYADPVWEPETEREDGPDAVRWQPAEEE